MDAKTLVYVLYSQCIVYTILSDICSFLTVFIEKLLNLFFLLSFLDIFKVFCDRWLNVKMKPKKPMDGNFSCTHVCKKRLNQDKKKKKVIANFSTICCGQFVKFISVVSALDIFILNRLFSLLRYFFFSKLLVAAPPQIDCIHYRCG